MSKDTIAENLGLRPLSEIEESTEEETLPAVQQDLFPAELEANAKENIQDIELARQNVRNIIDLGDDAVREMVEIAKQSESPRAFEVVSTLMKTLLDANKEYVEISGKKKYAKEETGEKPATQVTNNNLIVSTADLLKMLKGDDG
jgi:hypothetical protein